MRVELITDRETALKRAAKPEFKRSMTMREDLVAMEMRISSLELNRPLYIGFSVLDLSKLHMYKFHYEKMTHWFPKAELCFMDTDRFLYYIETDNLLATLKENSDDFDFSDYLFDHPFYDPSNRKVRLFRCRLLSLLDYVQNVTRFCLEAQ